MFKKIGVKRQSYPIRALSYRAAFKRQRQRGMTSVCLCLFRLARVLIRKTHTRFHTLTTRDFVTGTIEINHESRIVNSRDFVRRACIAWLLNPCLGHEPRAVDSRPCDHCFNVRLISTHRVSDVVGAQKSRMRHSRTACTAFTDSRWKDVEKNNTLLGGARLYTPSSIPRLF